MATIAKISAASIVRYAQKFGQNDDMTVLSITRLPRNRSPRYWPKP